MNEQNRVSRLQLSASSGSRRKPSRGFDAKQPRRPSCTTPTSSRSNATGESDGSHYQATEPIEGRPLAEPEATQGSRGRKASSTGSRINDDRQLPGSLCQFPYRQERPRPGKVSSMNPGKAYLVREFIGSRELLVGVAVYPLPEDRARAFPFFRSQSYQKASHFVNRHCSSSPKTSEL
jgi:hypothetical protein